MAEVISIGDLVRARRRAREQREIAACIAILRANLELALERLDTAPMHERGVRARQLRQLAELLEYVVERS